MSDTSSIGDRMKRYEGDLHLTRRVPVIVRVDGKAFHTLTKRFGKSWSPEFQEFMMETARFVSDEIQGCTFAYGQSDEISFLLTDYTTVKTQGWFDYDLNKIVSVSAALASSAFTEISGIRAQFDSRAFNIPQDDVCNYFLWRQRDATRNAIQMAARELYSHRELFGKDNGELQEMMWQKGVNFDSLPVIRKRGYCVVNGAIDDPPIFSKDRKYVDSHVYVRED